MATITKKAWPEQFASILNGTKTFDLRLGDFACQPGDILRLEEWDPTTKQYTGRTLEKTITYVMNTKHQQFWSPKDVATHGFQILGLT